MEMCIGNWRWWEGWGFGTVSRSQGRGDVVQEGVSRNRDTHTNFQQMQLIIEMVQSKVPGLEDLKGCISTGGGGGVPE